MARIAPLHQALSVKLPKRASLRHIGVPEGKDALAIYLMWLKQRSLSPNKASGTASSVRSSMESDEEMPPVSPRLATRFEEKTASVDLMFVGSQF
ncbi:hypothetical protein K469DRAFT_712542, partial [Zopfia rhizophila CBS 207.26]